MRINCGVGLLSRLRSRSTALGVWSNEMEANVSVYAFKKTGQSKRKRTRVIAALVARMEGRARSAFGAGGGRAATWGDAALGERFFAVGGFEDGTAVVRGSSWSVVVEVDAEVSEGGGKGWSRERADMKAWR